MAIGLICVLLGFLMGMSFSSCIGSILLQTSCNIYNLFSPSKQVKTPDFYQGWQISMATGFVQGVLGVAVQTGVIRLGQYAGAGDLHTAAVLVAVSWPFGVIVMAFMLLAMLDTTFEEGLIVGLIQQVVSLFICAIVVGGLFAIGAAAMLEHFPNQFGK